MPKPAPSGEGGWPWWRVALAIGAVALIVVPPLRLLFFALVQPVLLGVFINWLVRHSHQGSKRTTPATVVPLETLTAPYRGWVERGRALHGEIQSVAARLPSTLRRTFWPLTQQARELVADLERLAHSAQQMEEYLAGPHGKGAAAEAERLRRAIASTTDPIAREHLEQALCALEDTLADQQEIRTLAERAKAEAAHINASLQGVLSEVIKQRYTDLDTAREEYSSAAERLQSVKSHVDAVQQVITARPFPGG
jgi:hypothetical protein